MQKSLSKRVIQAIGLCALGVVLSVGPRVNAADHGDAPMASNNQSTDIADVFAFLDPNDNDRLILAMTQRGFIAAGENVNFGIFDQFLKYRFQLETTGDARPDQFIDITFSNIAFSPLTGLGQIADSHHHITLRACLHRADHAFLHRAHCAGPGGNDRPADRHLILRRPGG